MKKVTIYTTDYCPYCRRAKQILTDRGIPYEEHDVTGDDAQRTWLVERTGQKTVPQIFFDDDSVGGCSDLEALIKAGQLDARLG